MPTFDTPEPVAAVIETPGGHVRIRASDRADTIVEVHPTDPSEDADVQATAETRVEYAEGQLSVRAPRHKIRSLFGRAPSIEVTIDLPAGSRVDARGAQDFRSEGRIGECDLDIAGGTVRIDTTGRLKLRTAAGDVTVGRADGVADATTATGKIRIGAIDGTAALRTSNGDIIVGEVTGDARLNTANGDITVDRALAAVTAKTAFGNVRVGEVVRGSVVLETRFGEVEIGVGEGTVAWLDVSSQSGAVRSDLKPADGPGASDRTVEVHARTRYGDVVIRRP